MVKKISHTCDDWIAFTQPCASVPQRNNDVNMSIPSKGQCCLHAHVGDSSDTSNWPISNRFAIITPNGLQTTACHSLVPREPRVLSPHWLIIFECCSLCLTRASSPILAHFLSMSHQILSQWEKTLCMECFLSLANNLLIRRQKTRLIYGRTQKPRDSPATAQLHFRRWPWH